MVILQTDDVRRIRWNDRISVAGPRGGGQDEGGLTMLWLCLSFLVESV